MAIGHRDDARSVRAIEANSEGSIDMAIAVIFDLPDATQDEYNAVERELGHGDDVSNVPGLQFHAAGPSADGLRVIECWDSQEALDRFVGEELAPAMQRAGVNRQPSLQVLPLYRFVK
jgi:hypothetical protein